MGPATPGSKRHRVRQWLSSHASSPSSSPNLPASSATSVLQPNVSLTSTAAQQDFQNRVLLLLSQQDQDTIRKYSVTNPTDDNAVIQQTLIATRNKQATCQAKKWTFTFSGHTVFLQEKAESIAKWLDQFKQVGDVTSIAHPVHVRLPWTGIRLLLEAAVSEQSQMAALLLGLETTLYLSNRLYVYMAYWATLPASPARANFEDSLVEFHALILRFLAGAIRVYQKGTIASRLEPFWGIDEVSTFENECNKMASRAKTEASKCDQNLSTVDQMAAQEQHLKALGQNLKQLESMRINQTDTAMLKTEIDLSKLSAAAEASAPITEPSNPSAEEKSSDLHDRPVADTASPSPAPNSLWAEAWSILNDEDPELCTAFLQAIGTRDMVRTTSIQSAPPVTKSTHLDHFVQDSLSRMQDDQWKIGFAGHSVVVRSQLDRILGALSAAANSQLASSAAALDPVHAGLPLAGLCMMLKVFSADMENRATMLAGLEQIAQIIRRYSVIEAIYLTDPILEPMHSLRHEIVQLYRVILNYQANLICHLSKGSLQQYVRHVSGMMSWTDQRAKVRDADLTCLQLLPIADAARGIQSAGKLQEALTKQNERIRETLEASRKQDQEVVTELQQQRKEFLKWCQGTEARRCKEILRTSDYETIKDRNPDRTVGTCQWFLRHHAFQDWLDQSQATCLWVTADPGCGKSVLCKYLIDEYLLTLRQSGSTVCYFFFKDGDFSATVNHALCALLHQLVCSDEMRLAAIREQFEDNSEKLPHLFGPLWSAFVNVVTNSESGRIVCVLDALDECNSDLRLQFVRKIKDLFTSSRLSTGLKLLITSRFSTQISNAISGYDLGTLGIIRLSGESQLEMDTISSEINTVIKQRVREFAQLRQRQYNMNDDAPEHLLKRLSQIENRTYLWVSLIFGELECNAGLGKSALMKKVDNIPLTVSEAYQRILERSPDFEATKKVLQIVLAAPRPMTLGQLKVALNFDAADGIDAVDEMSDDSFRIRARELCGLFVRFNVTYVVPETVNLPTHVRETSREIALAGNFSTEPAVREYLEQQCVQETEREKRITENGLMQENTRILDQLQAKFDSTRRYLCLLFLLRQKWEPREEVSLIHQTAREFLDAQKPFQQRLMVTPRLSWQHCIDAVESNYLLASICVSFLQAYGEESNGKRTQTDSRPSYKEEFLEYAKTYWTEHYRAAGDRRSNLFNTTISLISSSNSIYCAHAAATDGRPHVLIGAIALNLEHLARHLCITKRDLLNIPNVLGDLPLQEAIKSGNSELVQYICDLEGVDVCARGPGGETALICAAKHGSSSDLASVLAVKAPLYPVDLSLRDDNELTALLAAAKSSRDSGIIHDQYEKCGIILEFALQHPDGFDVNARDAAGVTAVAHRVISAGKQHEEKIDQFLSFPGVDVNAKDNSGKTPLWVAAQEGNLCMLEQLVNAPGIDINASDDSGRTPIFVAIEQENQSCAVKLAQCAADPNIPDLAGRLPLSVAFQKGPWIAHELMRHCPNIDFTRVTEHGFKLLVLVIFKYVSWPTRERMLAMEMADWADPDLSHLLHFLTSLGRRGLWSTVHLLEDKVPPLTSEMLNRHDEWVRNCRQLGLLESLEDPSNWMLDIR